MPSKELFDKALSSIESEGQSPMQNTFVNIACLLLSSRHLQNTFPLLGVVLSLTALVCHTTHIAGTVRDSAHSTETYRKVESGHRQPRSRPPTTWLIKTLPIIYRLALNLSSLQSSSEGSNKFSAWVELLSGNYLLFLTVLDSSETNKHSLMSEHIEVQCQTLYGLHWLLDLILYCKAAILFGLPSWKSQLSQHLMVSCWLYAPKLITPSIPIAIDLKSKGNDSIRIYASPFEVASFSWLHSLIWNSRRQSLQVTNLWDLLTSEKCVSLMENLRLKRQSSSLLRQLMYSVRRPFLTQCLCAVITSVASYVPAIALQSILEHVETIDAQSQNKHIWLSLYAMLVFGAIHALADAQTVWHGEKLKIRIRDVLQGKMYHKVMKRGALNSRLGPDSGTILNLISSDSEKVADFGTKVHQILTTIPIRVSIAMYMLYQLLGPSSFVGIIIMLGITPLNSTVLRYMGRASVETSKATDSRVQETHQLVKNVRMIKLFAWEDLFHRRVMQKRSVELAALRTRLTWWSIMATLWYIVPTCITFAAFFSYTAVQRQSLTPSIAFTALSLFNLLKTPMDQLVGSAAMFQEFTSSLRRIEELLQEPEMSPSFRENLKATVLEDLEETFEFVNATLTLGSLQTREELPSTHQNFTLQNINLSFSPRKLHLLTGATGCGKTSLILGLLGESILVKGTISCPSGYVSYCAQEAWLTNDTIKNNILFGADWDAERYEGTIMACALGRDLATLELGDSTIAGENGAALSGGQKQRIALARAIYADTSHVFLDDCLSAVDSKTARWLVDNCITGPLMKGRTCIMAGSSIAILLPHAASVSIIENGNILVSGSPAIVLSSYDLFKLSWSKAPDVNERNNVHPPEYEVTEKSPSHSDVQVELTSTAQVTTVPPVTPEHSDSPDDVRQAHTINAIDKSAWDQLSFSTIWVYLSCMGGWTFCLVIATLFATQQLSVIAEGRALQAFTNAYSGGPMHHVKTSGPESVSNHLLQRLRGSSFTLNQHLSIYTAILVVYIVVNFGRLHVASIGSLSASKKLHEELLSSIVHTKYHVLSHTDHGSLLRRFVQDLQTVDHNVMPMALGTLHFFVRASFTVALIAFAVPKFFLPAMLAIAIYAAIGQLYLTLSKKLDHIKTQQRDSLYQHVSESLQGISTIRAFNQEHHFTQIHHAKLDAVNQVSLYLGAADCWLSLRLALVGTLMSFTIGSLALLSSETITAGAIGSLLTYALSFSDNIMWMVRYHAFNQQNFSAVDRISEMRDWQLEEQARTSLHSWNGKFPSGSIMFKNYSAKYRTDLPDVLKNITVEVRAGDRVGIVGRTGAGKSSLALAILRVLEVTAGSIEIDGIDITSLSLHDLRRATCFIPQDPSLFIGTLRDNLDPYGAYTDDQIRKVLADVGLHDKMNNTLAPNDPLPKDTEETHRPTLASLAMQITESGSNVSLGQRQLICLARALLQSPKLVILDEATASVDLMTERLIQDCLSKLDATVITIAHRLTSILDHDLVLVLDNGEVVEKGHPKDLLRHQGAFRSLCESHGSIVDLENLSKRS